MVGGEQTRPDVEVAASGSGTAGLPLPAAPRGTSKARDGRVGRGSWRPLLLQLGGIVLAAVLLAAWLLTADLTPTEQTTLSPSNLISYTMEHLALTGLSAAIVLVIAIPLGIVLTRKTFRKLTGPVLAAVNVGQAAPSIGVIVLLAAWVGFNFQAAVTALVLYALLPVLRNTMVGISQVDPRLVEAGRGMGMSAFSVLLRVELPLAVPIMLAGIRTALVLLVGTASLATFINGGGLGILITTGVNLSLTRVLVAGALTVALLALLIDWVGRVVEHVARPKGLA
jgi:osmoprotectant transport system permease protein